HARAHVEGVRDDVDRFAAVRPEHERGAPALMRPSFQPVHPRRRHVGVAEGARRPDQRVDGDRGRPGAVGRDGGHRAGFSQNTYGTRPWAPSAYQTPNARLMPPNPGASWPNERRTRWAPSVRPRPVDRSIIEIAVQTAKSAS